MFFTCQSTYLDISFRAMLLTSGLLLHMVMHSMALRFGPLALVLEAIENERLEIECTVYDKDATQTVKWKRDDDENLSGKTTFEEINNNEYTLTLIIESVDRSDKGDYICCVLDEKGSEVQTKTLELKIQEIPGSTYPVCGEVPTATEGQEVRLTCNSEKVVPIPTLQWYRQDKFNGTLHKMTEVSKTEDEFYIHLDLTFIATAVNNKETYICKLFTPVNTAWGKECQRMLHVRYKPIVNISGSPNVEVGRETVFICESPTKAEYTWHFSIPSTRVKLEADSQILRYHDPRSEDDGKRITCTAMNDVGSSSVTLTLSVKELTSSLPYGPSQATGHVYSQNSKTRSLSFVTAVAGGCTAFLLVLLLVFAGCIQYHTNRDFRNTYNVAQPDVYFEPRDRVLQVGHGSCMRSVGVQVPRDIELEFVYHEIESKKSGSSCSARTYSTGYSTGATSV